MKRFSAAIFIKDNEILLGKRSSKREFFPDVWDFIGGHCIENESFEQAMLREILEEIGVTPTKYELFLTIDKNPNFIMQIYIVREWNGAIENISFDENEIISWFSLAKALKLNFPTPEYKDIIISLNLSSSTIA